MKNVLFTLSCMAAGVLHAQEVRWRQVQDVEVYHADTLLRMAWAGGMNCPQFSAMDLDGDGREDLVVFEREGNVVKTFLYGRNGYTYTPEYEKYFPQLKNWMLLSDHDGDGYKDIFAFNVLGMEIWTRGADRDSLYWEKEYFDYTTPSGVVRKDAVKTVGQSGWDININVNYQDIPAISDIDGDGRPDILCFGLTTALPQGVTLEYFRQTAPLEFTREDYCWGGFVQSYTSNDIYLDVCRTQDTDTLRPMTKMMHLGSALLAMDVSGNGLKDIIMGELSFPNATVVYNTGSRTYARMSSCDASFPQGDEPVDVENLPAFYAVDTDHDGEEELIVAPAVTGSENHDNVHLYKNISGSGKKRFVHRSRDFMVGEMIDVGEGSRVVFADMDRDGREDMLLSSYGRYVKKNGGYDTRIYFYKNTGTASRPVFILRDDDVAGLSSWGRAALHPAVGDINADGVADMVVGDADGYLHILLGEKDGSYTPLRYYVAGADIGSFAMPVLWDVNEDGLADIVAGSGDGRLYLFLNEGTKTSPYFSHVRAGWAGVDYTGYASQGNSLCPSFYRQGGKVHMMVGLYDGTVDRYVWHGGDDVELAQENMLGVRVGKNAAPSHMVTSAGEHYIACGNMAGGLSLFLMETKDDDAEEKDGGHMTVYPNPCDDVLHFRCDDDACGSWVMYDTSGKVTGRGDDSPINVKHLPRGVYILHVRGVSGSEYVSRVIRR